MFCILIAVFAFVLKLVFTVAALLGILLCILAAFFVFRKLFGKKTQAANSDGLRQAALWSNEGEVQLFKEEPKVHQLVDKSSANLPAANVLTVSANAEVSVLEESDIALRIKIKTGDHKGRVGWVDKSYVIGYSPKD